MGRELFITARYAVESKLPAQETETLDDFIAKMKEQQGTAISAYVTNRPVNTGYLRAGGPIVWDEEYVTTYTTQLGTGRYINHTETYGPVAYIEHSQLFDSNINQKREQLKNRCLKTALHRFQRIKAQGINADMQLLENGLPTTEARIREIRALETQPFLVFTPENRNKK